MHNGHDANDDDSYAENGDSTLNYVTSSIEKNEKGEDDGDYNTLDGVFNEGILSSNCRPSTSRLSEVFHLVRCRTLLVNNPLLPFFVFDLFFFSGSLSTELRSGIDFCENDFVVFYAEELRRLVEGAIKVIFIVDPFI